MTEVANRPLKERSFAPLAVEAVCQVSTVGLASAPDVDCRDVSSTQVGSSDQVLRGLKDFLPGFSFFQTERVSELLTL